MARITDSCYRVDGVTVYQGDAIVATFDQDWRAKQWAEKMDEPSEEFLYFQDVRGMAESIASELADQVNAGCRGETLREWLYEHMNESIDGCQRVIYTYQAKQCLLYSRNDGAYEEEFGAEGMVEDGCIMWSRLAYAAFMADVKERLESDGVDLNDPGPKCEECDSSDAEEKIGDEWYCETCASEKREVSQ